ncbi:MAG: hypothetical protein Q9163_003295 [Psora crenata]
MAAIKPEDATEVLPSIRAPSNCVDAFDIEQYINHENMVFPSPSASPHPTYANPSTTATPTTSSQDFELSQVASQQTFSGPSHQYEQYRQQSSLPVGAVANTFALNESDHFSYGQNPYDLVMPPESYLDVNGMEDFVDFGAMSGQTPMDTHFATQELMPTLDTASINPSVVDGRESSPNPQEPPSQPVRAWPGMHQQQAAMQAKAQAEAQAQRQQHMERQSTPSSRTSSSTRHGNADPHVEESIARLLDRMRRSSVNPPANDDIKSDGKAHSSQGGRPRKDEEDMDEDERLLASEEGKKLSSRERRQLRNKVSARAFRSRRKGEIAAKCTEADELRTKNEALMAENSRLTDLTRMLLSSPHFSNFLEDLSATNGSVPELSRTTSLEQQQQQQQQQQKQSSTRSQPTIRKDTDATVYNQGRGQYQNSVRVGLTRIPESPYENTGTEAGIPGWGPNESVGNMPYDAQVYALTSLPLEPVIDGSLFSGKSTIEPLSSFGSKDDGPTIERMPPGAPTAPLDMLPPPGVEEDGEYDDSDPAFALYADRPVASEGRLAWAAEVDGEDGIFGDIAPEKAFGRLELVVPEDSVAAGGVRMAAWEKFQRIESRMASLGAGVEAATAHIS